MGLGIGLGLSIPIRTPEGVGGGAAAFLRLLAKGTDSFWYDSQRLFQDTGGATPAVADGDPIGLAIDRGGRGNHATQGTGTAQAALRFDGSIPVMRWGGNDFMATPLVPGSTMCLIAKHKGSVSGLGFLIGARDSTDTRLVLAKGTDGIAAAGVGTQSTSTITGGDALATVQVSALVADGSTVKVYQNGILVYSGAQSGSIGNVRPLYIGAWNDIGAAGVFFTGDTYHLAAIKGYAPDADEILEASEFLLNEDRDVLEGFAYAQEAFSTWAAGLDDTGCTVEELGLASDGTSQVYGLSIGDVSKPALFILGVLHGAHEWRGAYITRRFMSYLASPPAGSEQYFRRILDTFRVYCIPCANPYGYENNIYGNANGVNLNRNFGVFWDTYDDSLDAATKGSAAFSEPETQYIRDKVEELLPVGFLDHHIQGSFTGCQIEALTAADEAFWTALATSFDTAINPAETRYNPADPMPQSQQWARTVVASNGHKPLSGSFEPGGAETEFEQARIGLNFLLRYCLAMVDQVAAGWPQGDAVVYVKQPDNGNGVETQISAGAVNGNYGVNDSFSAGKAGGDIRRALIKVGVGNFDPGIDIQSAVLTLKCSSENAATAYVIDMKRALLQWYPGASASGATPGAGVDASTWNNRNHNGTVAWGTSGGQSGVDYDAVASDSVAVAGAGVTFEWDVTADVQSWVSGVATNLGWWLINQSEATENSRKVFLSSEYSVPADRPKLTVTYK